nr:MAG TPA: DNA-directed RNA polymerase II subunit [Caudoviricetes sp.]
MTEYIERQAALDALQAPEMFGITPYHIELINRIPAADVAPVAHGEWIVCGDGADVPFMCSHCGKRVAASHKRMYDNYCPNCGAKMDLEESKDE